MIAWKPRVFYVNLLHGSSQAMHCHVSPFSGLLVFYCSFVYGFNDQARRNQLWRFLKDHNTNDPQVICGDMICVMSVEKRIGYPYRRS